MVDAESFYSTILRLPQSDQIQDGSEVNITESERVQLFYLKMNAQLSYFGFWRVRRNSESVNDDAIVTELRLVREDEVELDIMDNTVKVFHSKIATYNSAFNGQHPAIDDLKDLVKKEQPEGAPLENGWQTDGDFTLAFEKYHGKIQFFAFRGLRFLHN